MSKGVYYTMGLNSSGFMSGAQSVQSMLARLDQSVAKLATAAQRMNLNVQVNGTEKAASGLSRTAVAAQKLKATFATLSNIGNGVSNIVNGIQSARQGITMLQSLATSGGRAGQMLRGAAGAAQRFGAMLRSVSWQKLIAGAAAATVAVSGVVIAYRAASLAARGGASALAMPFKTMAAAARTAASAVRGVGVAVTGALSAGLTAMLSPLGLAIGAVGALTAGFKALSLGADFEQMSVGMNTILKDAKVTAGLLSQIQKFAGANGQSMFDVSKGARSLLGGGFGIDQMMPLLKMMGDVAAGAQTDIGGLILVLNQVKGKGKFYAEELQQFAERGVTGLREALAKVRGTSIEQLSKDMEDGKLNVDDLIAALTRLTAAGGMFHNAMANQSKTTLGMIATLKSKFQELILVFSSPANDSIKPMIQGLINGFDKVIVKARTLMGAFGVAAAHGKLGDLIFGYLRPGIAKAANYMVQVFYGVLSALNVAFENVIKPFGEALEHSLLSASASFRAGIFETLLDINASLPSFMPKLDRSKLMDKQMDSKMQSESHKNLAAGAFSGINLKEVAKQLVPAFNRGFESAPKLFDDKISDVVKDAETAARINRNNQLMEESAALKKVTNESKGAIQNLQNLSTAISKTQSTDWRSRFSGDDGNLGSAPSQRRRIKTLDAAQSAARRFMRLSPAAQKHYDGSFDAFFGKGPKKTPEEMARDFYKGDAGAAVAKEQIRKRGKGGKGFGSMNEFLNQQSENFFRGLPGASARGNGKGTSVLEKLLGDVVAELKGVKSSVDSIQTA